MKNKRTSNIATIHAFPKRPLALLLAEGKQLEHAYALVVRDTLLHLLPRIEAGEFSDMGDNYRNLKPNEIPPTLPAFAVGDHVDAGGRLEIDPGICLLEGAVRETQICQMETTAKLIVAATRFDIKGYGNDLDCQTWAIQAAHCLARDVRQAYRRYRNLDRETSQRREAAQS